MTKDEYNQQKEEIVKLHGVPEWDMSDPVNQSARLLKALRSDYMSSIKQKNDKVRLEHNLEQSVKYTKSVPIGLTDLDLKPFSLDEQEVLIMYFEDTNLTAKELQRQSKLGRKKIEALFRSGPFIQLASRVFGSVGQPRVMWALLKLVEEKNPKICELLGRHFGVLKDESLNINVNKPLEIDPEMTKKLKELGDNA